MTAHYHPREITTNPDGSQRRPRRRIPLGYVIPHTICRGVALICSVTGIILCALLARWSREAALAGAGIAIHVLAACLDIAFITVLIGGDRFRVQPTKCGSRCGDVIILCAVGAFCGIGAFSDYNYNDDGQHGNQPWITPKDMSLAVTGANGGLRFIISVWACVDACAIKDRKRLVRVVTLPAPDGTENVAMANHTAQHNTDAAGEPAAGQNNVKTTN